VFSSTEGGFIAYRLRQCLTDLRNCRSSWKNPFIGSGVENGSVYWMGRYQQMTARVFSNPKMSLKGQFEAGSANGSFSG
jgi:hypothetical protein